MPGPTAIEYAKPLAYTAGRRFTRHRLMKKQPAVFDRLGGVKTWHPYLDRAARDGCAICRMLAKLSEFLVSVARAVRPALIQDQCRRLGLKPVCSIAANRVRSVLRGESR